MPSRIDSAQDGGFRSVAGLYLMSGASTPFDFTLGTVPLTSGLVAQIFGVRYMATLFGFVFFSHQLGSFTGAWYGGRVYDTTGSYDTVWWGAVALGVLSAALHWPIREGSILRAAAQEA